MSAFAVAKPLDFAIYVAVGGLCWYLVWWTRSRYDVRGLGSFGIVLGLEGTWALNSAAKLLIADPGWQMTLARADVVMMMAVPLFWFRFATEYVGTAGRWSRAVYRGGAVVGLAAVAAVVLSPVGSVWTDVEVVREPFVHLHPVPGPLYLVLAAVAGILFLGGFLHVLEAVLTTRQTTFAMVALSIGMTFPAFFLLEYLLGLGLFHEVNYTSMGVGAFMILTTGAVFSDLFELNPLPRKEILASVNDGVLVLDDRRRIVDHNDRLTEYVEPGSAELIGEPFETAFPAVAETVTLADGSEAFLEADGRSFRVDVSEIRRGGSTIGWDVVVTDVTALKRQQRQLRRRNEQLDEFASAVSHDLRNPLNVAALHLELALDSEEGNHLRAVADAHERMETIIDDLLALSRGRQAPEDPGRVELEPVANRAWSYVDTPEASLEVGRNGHVVADRARLQTIFENLFRNAVEHAGDDVTVAVDLVDDAIVVEDDGPGIPREDADRVFEYGYSTGEEGTGLGLAIVRTMAESHGWTVDLDRSGDAGARFVISGVRVPEASDDPGSSEPASPA